MSLVKPPEYHDQPSKAAFVLRRYSQILCKASVLDVGGGRGHLGAALQRSGSRYTNIDFHPKAHIKADLERALPFIDDSFQVVICLDVLEHLERLHACFDECCRVSQRWLIFLLPNAWCSFFHALRDDEQARRKSMKQIGLPANPPPDRHRWFFNDLEAEKFLRNRGRRNGLVIRSLERTGVDHPKSVKWWLWRRMLRLALSKDLSLDRLQVTSLWCLMEKTGARE